jgi:hypothetical protein
MPAEPTQHAESVASATYLCGECGCYVNDGMDHWGMLDLTFKALQEARHAPTSVDARIKLEALSSVLYEFLRAFDPEQSDGRADASS